MGGALAQFDTRGTGTGSLSSGQGNVFGGKTGVTTPTAPPPVAPPVVPPVVPPPATGGLTLGAPPRATTTSGTGTAVKSTVGGTPPPPIVPPITPPVGVTGGLPPATGGAPATPLPPPPGPPPITPPPAGVGPPPPAGTGSNTGANSGAPVVPPDVNNQPTAPTSTPSGKTILPDPLVGSFQNSSQTIGDIGSQASALLPTAGNFIGSMLGDQPTQAALGLQSNAAGLGQMALNNQEQQIDGMFQGSPFHSGLAPAKLDAANQFALQQGQLGNQLALGQQQIGAGLAGLPSQAAFQAASANPALQTQLFQLLQGERLGGLGPALGALGQQAASAPVVTQSGNAKK